MARIDRPAEKTVVVLTSLLLLFALPQGRQAARVIRVISGDTLTIQYNARWEELKLLGVEAPEPAMNDNTYEKALKNSTTPEAIIRQGIRSSAYMSKLIHYGSQVWIEFDVQQRDHVGRLLGYVYLPNGKMLNEMILRSGFASPANFPPNLKYQDRFSSAFRRAKENKRGFWKPSAVAPPPVEK